MRKIIIGVSTVALDQLHTLYSVPCEDFAYNFIAALYVATDEAIAPALLPESDAAAGGSRQHHLLGRLGEMTGILSSHYKGGKRHIAAAKASALGRRPLRTHRASRPRNMRNTTEEWPIVARNCQLKRSARTHDR